jgi:hypothetical protein
MGDKGIEIVCGEEKVFSTGPTRAARADRHDKTNEPTMKVPLSFVLF